MLFFWIILKAKYKRVSLQAKFVEMKFRVGDTVKFLNQEGGGKVSKIISPDRVNVAIEDGFDIPTMVKDLVKVDNDSPLGRYFGESYNVDVNDDIPVVAPRKRTHIASENAPVKQEVSASPSKTSRKQPVPYRSNDATFRKGVYLAFVPEDQAYLVSGNINIYLVNHTESDILFSIFLKSSDIGYTGREYDTLDAASMIHIDNITRDEINNWSSGIVQVLFHNEKQEKVLEPLTSGFRIQGVRLYKEDNYKQTYFFGQKAFLFLLGEIAHQQAVAVAKKDVPKEEEKKEVQKAKVQRNKSLIENHRIDNDIAEVDLHISALREDYGQLKNSEILRYQMDYFHRALDNAIAKSFHKVIFIHGIGNGILRDALTDYLRKNYPGFPRRNASFQKYGYGAIEVEIIE